MLDIIVPYFMAGIMVGLCYLVAARIIDCGVDWKIPILITLITIFIWPIVVMFSVIEYAKDLDKRALERNTYKRLYKSYNDIVKDHSVSELITFSDIMNLEKDVLPEFSWNIEKNCLEVTWSYKKHPMSLYVHNTYVVIEYYNESLTQSAYSLLINNQNLLDEIRDYNKKCREA